MRLCVGGIEASCGLLNLGGWFRIEETQMPALVHITCGGLERSVEVY